MGKLGDTLRERRHSLGMTVAQAEEGTRIRATLLEALEEGDYGRLPNPGYVRGYVSSYARFLDLDPASMLTLYTAETGAARGHDLNLPVIEEAVAPMHQQHAVPWGPAIAVAAVLAVVSLAVWGISSMIKGPEKPLPVPKTATDTASPATETTTPNAGKTDNSSSGTQDQTKNSSSAQVDKLVPFTLKVTVAPNGASWVTVIVDGQQAYSGTLTGGQSKSFEVAKSAIVKIGKPSEVTVTKDGKPVTIPSGGNVPTLTLKASPQQ